MSKKKPTFIDLFLGIGRFYTVQHKTNERTHKMIKRISQTTTNDDFAIITHYLQNANSKYALPFEKDALELLYGKLHYLIHI